MSTKIVKRWMTKAGLHALVVEGAGTTCYVGVDPDNRHYTARRQYMNLEHDVLAVVSGVSFAGMLSDSGLLHAERALWWFGFLPGEELKLADIEKKAEALARVLQAK